MQATGYGRHGERWAKWCLLDSTRKLPSFNFEGMKPGLYCEQPAEDGMVDIHRRRFIYGSCTILPNFNFEGRRQAFCIVHGEDGIVNIPSRSERSPHESSMDVGV